MSARVRDDSSFASGRSERLHFDGDTSFDRDRMTIGRAQQPASRSRVTRTFIKTRCVVVHRVARTRADHLQAYHIVATAQAHLHAVRATRGIGICADQRDGQCELQRAGIGRCGQYVAHLHDITRDVARGGVVRDERDRGVHRVSAKYRLGSVCRAVWQLTNEQQQLLQSVRFRAQRVQRSRTACSTEFEQRRDGSNRPDAIAQRMCQPTQQLVVHGEPSRGAVVFAHR